VRLRSLLAAFLLLNAFTWLVWALTEEDKGGAPWPIWLTLSTGFLLAWRASGASFRGRRRDR
jgi:hypothetical protein